MKTPRNVLFYLAAALLFACNFPFFASAPTLSAIPSDTPAASSPTLTAAPTITPTDTLTPTPSVPQVTPNSVNVNCRSGPDVAYDATSVLKFGQTAQIAGRNEDSSWWYIADPMNAGQFCWVAASVVTTSGNLSGVPVIAPPAAIVTSVSVDVTLPSPVYCGGPNPIDWSGTIKTNGATKVTYQWELTGDKSLTTSPVTINFKSAGSKDIPDEGAYNVDCGTYTMTLHVLSPNDTSASQKFKIKP